MKAAAAVFLLLALGSGRAQQHEMTNYVMGLFYRGPRAVVEQAEETNKTQAPQAPPVSKKAGEQ